VFNVVLALGAVVVMVQAVLVGPWWVVALAVAVIVGAVFRLRHPYIEIGASSASESGIQRWRRARRESDRDRDSMSRPHIE